MFNILFGGLAMTVGYVKAALGIALVLGSAAAYAQLGNGGTTYSGVGAGGGAGPMMEQFVAVSQSVMAADAGMLAALGMQAEADKAGTQVSALRTDSTPGGFEAAVKAQTATAAILERALGAGGVVPDQAKAGFTAAVDAIAAGIRRYAALSGTLPEMKKQLRLAGGDARSALYVTRVIPGALSELRQTLKAALAFSRANNIPVSEEAAATGASL